jgi:hypothetical protein
MQETLNANDTTQLSKQKFALAISELISVHIPSPEDPHSTEALWPWRHIANKAFEKVLTRYSDKVSQVTLNPQPLPPKVYFSIALAEEVIDRALLMLEVANGFINDSEERSIIIVSGYINKFVDEISMPDSSIKFPKKRWPFPLPPDPEVDSRWSGLELAVIGTFFQNEARCMEQGALQRVFSEAGEKIFDAAFSRN